MQLPNIVSLEKKDTPTSIQVFEIKYEENGKLKTKEVVKSLDIVKILIYHKEKDAFVLIQQFRPMLYLNYPQKAMRYELCGGRVDKDLTLEQIAIEEVYEETGYQVESLQKITSVYESGKETFYYVEVTESMRVNAGGGIDDENIQLYFLPREDVKDFIFDEKKAKRKGTVFALMWYLCQKG